MNFLVPVVVVRRGLPVRFQRLSASPRAAGEEQHSRKSGGGATGGRESGQGVR